MNGRAILITSFRDGQTPIAPIVHPKMNTRKEPFKRGMESAECGVACKFGDPMPARG
jgi:hypothetical protein